MKVLGKSDEIHEMISTFEKIKNKECQNILGEGGKLSELFLDSFHLKLCSTLDSQESTMPLGKVFFSDGVAFKSSASIELVDFSTGQVLGQFQICKKLGNKVCGSSTESFLSATPHLVAKLGSRPVSC